MLLRGLHGQGFDGHLRTVTKRCLLYVREKDLQRALQQQEKQASRLRQRDGGFGPRDDLDIEMDALLEAAQSPG